MPGGDGTGPRGFGPRTGRAMGYCVGYNVPGCMNPNFGPGFGPGRGPGFGPGRGPGFGPGRGRGRRFFINQNSNPYYDEPIAKAEEKEILGQEVRGLEAELKWIRERLKTLESKE